MNQNPLRLSSPPKLNLFLHITGQREDGYHLLQTVFHLLELDTEDCDELIFSPNESGIIKLSPSIEGLADDDNLVVRAARLLQETTQTAHGADITLHKRLPIGGGIGGGSSNAATTLLALNQLWQLKLSLNQLAELGLQLGADVPIFVHGHSAWAEGVGEQLTPFDLPECWYVVLHPKVFVSTQAIFGSTKLQRNTESLSIEQIHSGNLEKLSHNDCQPVVEAQYPEIKAARQWLELYAPARLTGTGACVFASFPNKAAAERVVAQCPTRYGIFIAKGCQKSLTHQQLAKYVKKNEKRSV